MFQETVVLLKHNKLPILSSACFPPDPLSLLVIASPAISGLQFCLCNVSVCQKESSLLILWSVTRLAVCDGQWATRFGLPYRSVHSCPPLPDGIQVTYLGSGGELEPPPPIQNAIENRSAHSGGDYFDMLALNIFRAWLRSDKLHQ